jgi:Uma2 family endonuclease
MAAITQPFPRQWTLADLLAKLGDVSPKRIRLTPLPGLATEEDVLRLEKEGKHLCELIDGVLVEKVMGYHESKLAVWIAHLLQLFLDDNNLGELAGPDGTLRLMPGLVRIPDVSFVSHQRMAECPNPASPIPDLAPDLAIEVLSEGNTAGEIDRKLKDYFFTGTKLVWLVDPRTRTVQVSTAPDVSTILGDKQELTSEPVLPGFRVPVARLFERMKDQPPTRGRRKKS